MNVPNKIWIYRITHVDNLSYILKNGIFTSDSPSFDPDYKSIGDLSLINYRKNLDACNPPGGKLSEYVPFYLGPRSPMLYQIAKGYEDISKQSQEDIIYLIVSVERIITHNLSFFFTDGHARSGTSTYYNSIKDFDQLDWSTIYSNYWKSDETDLRRKEKKQSEFLIKTHVPVSCIEYLGVYNNSAKQKVLDLILTAGVSLKIRVSPDKLYYDNL